MENGKANHDNDDDDDDDDDDSELQPQRALIVRVLSGVVLVFLILLAVMPDREESYKYEEKHTASAFWEGDLYVNVSEHIFGPGRVLTFHNFLPARIAEHIYSSMQTDWERTQRRLSSCPVEGQAVAKPHWLYTTNIPNTNAKIRLNHNISARKKEVQDEYARDRYSFQYSKWELNPQTEAFRTLRHQMERSEVKRAIGAALGQGTKLKELTDLFLTCFAEGDFLGRHSDMNSGIVTFVLTLAKEWSAEQGGVTDVFCPWSPHILCESVLPAFNQLIVFRTRPVSLVHEVKPVHSRVRFAASGWYMDGKAVLDEQFYRELQAMKSKY